MTAEEALSILRRYWRSIVATLLVVGAVATGVLMMQPRVYSATAQVNFLPKRGATQYDLKSTIDFARTQAETYAQLARTPTVMDPVRKSLGLQVDPVALGSRVNAFASKEQPLITITISGSNPEEVAALTNAVAKQLVASVPDFSPAETLKAIDPQVTLPAVVPSRPSSPDLRNSALVAAAIAVAAAIGQAYVRSILNTRVTRAADIHRVTDLPVMGEIPVFRAEKTGHDVRDEAYRDLRTNLEFRGLEDHGNLLMVTSSIAGEGKTTTAAKVARALAQIQQPVLIIDCDLRRPRLHEEFGIDGTVGLTTALLRKIPVSELVHRIDEVDVLPAGRRPPNPAELLRSRAMQQLLADAQEHYSAVILDAPPILPVTDSVTLARQGAGVIVVAKSGQVRRRQLGDALGKLEAVKATVLGVVLNGIPTAVGHYYGYGYGYAPEADAAARAQRAAVEDS